MRINFRFLGILCIVLVAIGLILFGVNQFQKGRNSARLLVEAQKAKSENRFSHAESLFRRYLALENDSVEARIELGRLRWIFNDPLSAYLNFENALRLDESRDDVRLEIVGVALRLQRYADAKEHLTRYLTKEENHTADNEWLLGEIEKGLGNFERAEAQYRKASEHSKNDIRHFQSLVDLLTVELKKPDEARKLLDKFVNDNSQLPAAYITRGEWLLERAGLYSKEGSGVTDGMYKQAWEDAEHALSLQEADPKAAVFAVDAALITGQVEMAREISEKAISKSPNVPKLYGSAANIELNQNKLEKACDLLRQGLKANPGDGDLLWNLAQLEIQQGNVDTAKEVISELRLKKYDEGAVRFLQAKVLAKEGKWREVVKQIEDSRALFERNSDLLLQADFLLANSYQNLGSRDQQLLTLRRVISQNPLWTPARVSLADTLFASGRTQEAINEYSQIASQPNAPIGAVLSYARLLFIDGLSKGASQADWTEFNRVMKTLRAEASVVTETTLLDAEMLVWEEKYDEARELIERLLTDRPEEKSLWLALTSLSLREKDFEKAEETLKRAASKLKDSPELRLEQAKLLVQKYGKDVNLDSISQLAVSPESWSENQKMHQSLGFMGLFLGLQEYERCERLAMEVNNSPAGRANLSIQLLLFDLAYRSNNLESMVKTLDRVKEIEGTGPLWRVGNALRLSVAATKDSNAETSAIASNQAINELSEAAVLRPAWMIIPKLKGEIYDRLENKQAAIESYLQAVNLGEKSPQTIAKLMYLLYEQGRYVEADEIVRKLQEQQTPFTLELAQVASQVSLQLDNFDRALDLAEEWANKSNTQADRIWLAQVYSIASKTAEAEREFRNAIQMNPTSASPWVSLAQMYSRLGQSEKVLQIIEEAKTNIDPNHRSDALAQCYEALLDFEKAEFYYLDALTIDPNSSVVLRRLADYYLKSSQLAKAEPVLKRITEAVGDNHSPDKTWARRQLALLLGPSVDKKRYAQAVELLEENLNEFKNSVEDRRALAVVLSTQQDEASLLKAITILEGVVREQPRFSIADNFLLAKIYAKTNQPARFKSLMLSVLTNGGANESFYIQAYIDHLLETKHSDEARLWVQRLKAIAPQERSIDAVEAQLLLQADDYARLQTMLEDRIANNPDQLAWASGFSEVAAIKAQQKDDVTASKFYGIAENGFKKLAESIPNQKIQLVGYYARHGKAQESLDMLDRTGEEWPNQLADIGQAAMNSTDTTEAALNAIIVAVESTVSNFPKNTRLAICLADMKAWLKRPKESIEDYKKVLQDDPSNLLALNNLAMISAVSNEELDIAYEKIQKAIEIYGEREYLLDTRGIVQLSRKNAKEAESDFRNSIRLRDSADKQFHLALALRDQSRTPEAKQAFEQARRMNIRENMLHPLERESFNKLESELRAP